MENTIVIVITTLIVGLFVAGLRYVHATYGIEALAYTVGATAVVSLGIALLVDMSRRR